MDSLSSVCLFSCLFSFSLALSQAFVLLRFRILSSQKSSNAAMTSTPSTIIPTLGALKKKRRPIGNFLFIHAMLLGNLPHLVFNDQWALHFVTELLRYFLAIIAILVSRDWTTSTNHISIVCMCVFSLYVCIVFRSVDFICNFYTYFSSMDENEEDIEENDSDIDGEVMNMASDLMCSTPPGASPMTLSSSSFLSTSTQSM